MNLSNILNFLKKFQQEKIYKLFLLNEHTDEEFEDMDDYVQSNEEMKNFMYTITNNSILYLSETIQKYFELHYDEPSDYLTSELLMLLYYMADTNELDTSNLTKELKEQVNDTMNVFKEILQLEDETLLNQKIILLNELLNKTLPLACNHMVSVADSFDKSNMYQQLMDNFGNNFDKYIDSMLPTDNEKENFLNIINNLTCGENDDKYCEITDDIINKDIINKDMIDNYDEKVNKAN